MTPIRFFDKNMPYYEFSNFYDKAPLTIDGKHYLTSEHYFQAAKFEHIPDYHKLIMECDSPKKVTAMARQQKLTRYHTNLLINKKTNRVKVNDMIEKYKNIAIRDDWEDIKDDVMRKVIKVKFDSYPQLKQKLVGTGDLQLIEASPYDSYWGEGRDGKGKNRLGKLLMELRHTYRV